MMYKERFPTITKTKYLVGFDELAAMPFVKRLQPLPFGFVLFEHYHKAMEVTNEEDLEVKARRIVTEEFRADLAEYREQEQTIMRPLYEQIGGDILKISNYQLQTENCQYLFMDIGRRKYVEFTTEFPRDSLTERPMYLKMKDPSVSMAKRVEKFVAEWCEWGKESGMICQCEEPKLNGDKLTWRCSFNGTYEDASVALFAAANDYRQKLKLLQIFF